MTSRRFPERVGHVPDAALAAIREATANAVASGIWKTDPPAKEVILAGVRALTFPPPGGGYGTLLHFHGGGFRIGCPEMIGPLASALAARCGITVICPAYRLAPEHPFPSALNDVWSVWQALRQSVAGPIVISGDSAGGGLAASLASLCATEKSRPAGMALLSPWLDLTLTSRCYDDNATTDPVFSRAAAVEGARLYLQGASPGTPLASPMFSNDLDGFPPTFVNVGDGEVLADDSRRFDALLRASGVRSTLSTVAGMEHVAVTRGFDRTGAAETFEQLALFLKNAVGRQT